MGKIFFLNKWRNTPKDVEYRYTRFSVAMVDAVVDAVVDWPPSVRKFSRLGRAVRDLDHPVPQLPL